MSFLISPDGAATPLDLHNDVGDSLQARGDDGEGRGRDGEGRNERHIKRPRLSRRHVDGETETAWSHVVEAAPAPAGWRPGVTRLDGLEVRPKPGPVVGLPKSRTGKRNRREEASMTTRDESGDLTPTTRFATNWERWTGTAALTGSEICPFFRAEQGSKQREHGDDHI
jgi:hypothetical protein